MDTLQDKPAYRTGRRIFSGVQPSGVLHLGNYLGALKQWVQLQENNEAYFCIVDAHAITVPYEPKELPERVVSTAALYIAAGISPDKSVVFVQSHVPAHMELAWYLSTITPYGELTRMTQFKDKTKKQAEGTSVGLFTYPLLMAADILLYQTQVVPVGEDQKQHIELARDIAERFNNRFGKVFTIPEAYVPERTARVMSLADPTKKMSKSDEPKTYVALTDEPDIIRKKIMSAVTETEPVFSFTKSGLAVKNLLHIYEAVSGENPEAIEKTFAGKGYQEFKEALTDKVIAALQPLQERYLQLRENDDDVRIMLGRGQHHAQQVATQTLARVKEAMGLL